LKCKFCDKIDVEWPENYVKGCKPIEMETGIEHNRERCDSFKNQDMVKRRTNDWYVVNCITCGLESRQNPKHFRKPDDTTFTCKECNDKKFINLNEYGIEL